MLYGTYTKPSMLKIWWERPRKRKNRCRLSKKGRKMIEGSPVDGKEEGFFHCDTKKERNHLSEV